MRINEDVLKGKWREIKGEVQKAWGKLTNDELEQTKGDLKAIGGLVQQKYGEDKEVFQERMAGIVDRFHDRKDETMEEIKTDLKH